MVASGFRNRSRKTQFDPPGTGAACPSTPTPNSDNSQRCGDSHKSEGWHPKRSTHGYGTNTGEQRQQGAGTAHGASGYRQGHGQPGA